VNGTVRPGIAIAAGERQFWRIVNASPDLYADLQVDGVQLEIVALGWNALAFHDPAHPIKYASHILVPPAAGWKPSSSGPGIKLERHLELFALIRAMMETPIQRWCSPT